MDGVSRSAHSVPRLTFNTQTDVPLKGQPPYRRQDTDRVTRFRGREYIMVLT